MKKYIIAIRTAKTARKRGFLLRMFQTGNDICFGKYDAGKTHRSGNNRNRFKRR
ncbi:hypothetical protein [[Clostridium] scindens]|uniref:hypothetical protein n=1 Tax=Clostridium scindens (strain JCM 10418 / VPI 12708) TaxID=29347 RepID=UPI00298CC7F5|nr:hypothetical protein [[Clostridium] scindens]